MTTSAQARPEELFRTLLARLSLDDKVRLVTGRDFWSTTALPHIGLRSMLLSDGPSGVRGPRWDERLPSLNLPSASALAATWSPDLARRAGRVLAAEARTKDVDVVLGPTINLHRSPLGGRHFEAFSEDPYLTGVMGAAMVQGIQEGGVAATPKHYVCNDSETNRFDVDVVVDERTLHEVYLAPFEAAVDAGAWALMSAFNAVNGVTMTENQLLLDPMVDRWGFDGVVLSDWTAVRSIRSATAGQHLAMPGPGGPWGEALKKAVISGQVAESALDEKVFRLLRLAWRVDALAGSAPPAITTATAIEDGRQLAYEIACRSAVLLKNERHQLPLDAAAMRSIAVIGDSAARTRTQGGGSATVISPRVWTILDGLRERFGSERVTYARGGIVHNGPRSLPAMRHPDGTRPGALLRFLDVDGRELMRDDRLATELVFMGPGGPTPDAYTLELSSTYTPDESGEIALGVAGMGPTRLEVNGEVVLETPESPEDSEVGTFMSPPFHSVPVKVERAVPMAIRAANRIHHHPQFPGARGFTLGIGPEAADADDLLDEAMRVASTADVAVVVVGTNELVESEGRDRASLALPGLQDELVRRVVAANPRTIVVVNAGSPVDMPWFDDVPAVVLGWFGGQEMGRAIASVLAGDVDPGGRLPTSWSRREADAPILNVTPHRDKRLVYEEGIHIGYRAWLKRGRDPLATFGSGLSYTKFGVGGLSVAADKGSHQGVAVSFEAANIGDRAGETVMQVYLAKPESGIDRPVRWLAAFEPMSLAAGSRRECTLSLEPRAFEHWAGNSWAFEHGEYQVLVGTSVTDIETSVSVMLTS